MCLHVCVWGREGVGGGAGSDGIMRGSGGLGVMAIWGGGGGGLQGVMALCGGGGGGTGSDDIMGWGGGGRWLGVMALLVGDFFLTFLYIAVSHTAHVHLLKIFFFFFRYWYL